MRGAAAGLVAGTIGWLAFTVVAVGWMWPLPVAALIGAVLGATRWRRLLWITAGIGTGLAFLVAYTPVIVAPAHRLIRSDPLGPRAADAVVVLSAGLNEDALISGDGADRILTGLRLVLEHAAPRLVVTRLHRKVGRGEVTSEDDQRRLVALAHDSIALFSVDSVTTTREEALRFAVLARREGWTSVIVVTSPLHTSRACATFEKAGFRVTCVTSESREFAVRALRAPRDRLAAFRHWVYEVAGHAKYRWKGWI
ncbi:MAG: YdcF family protein [Gemmatimonadales bacterium]|nr:YdcF family protein [Gemmatimonadales bacterium]